MPGVSDILGGYLFYCFFPQVARPCGACFQHFDSSGFVPPHGSHLQVQSSPAYIPSYLMVILIFVEILLCYGIIHIVRWFWVF